MGRRAAAAAGRLTVLLSGRAEARQRAVPFLEPLGGVLDLGEDPASSLHVKLAFNFMISSLIESLSEAFSLVEKNGVSPKGFLEILLGSIFDAPAVRTYGELLLQGDFDQAGFVASLGRKDVSLVLDLARESGTPLPLAQLLESRFAEALYRGWGDRDWCVISLLQRELAGLPPRAPQGPSPKK
jgi:3-hydroxyisobutyrate dehydrogenase-like beta-hydroxyacid dehydrogenase